jgi:hypothetical protein
MPTLEKNESTLRREAGLAAWERRRKWSRTETARWLNDRHAPVLALLRRRPGQWPAYMKHGGTAIGYWIKENAPALFDAAHATLAAAKSDDARDALLPLQVLK